MKSVKLGPLLKPHKLVGKPPYPLEIGLLRHPTRLFRPMFMGMSCGLCPGSNPVVQPKTNHQLTKSVTIVPICHR